MLRVRFQNSKSRLDRAATHLQSFGDEWATIMNAEGTESTLRRCKDSREWLVSFVPSAETIKLIEGNTLALKLGEFAYQLRAALDGLMWDAVTYTQGTEPSAKATGISRLEFPVLSNEGDFKKRIFHNLPFPKNLIDWLGSIQPYSPEKPIGDPDRGMKSTIEDIHNLARLDRHRRLRLIAAVPGATEVEVTTTPPGAKVVQYEWLNCDPLNGEYDYLWFKVGTIGGLIPYKVSLKTRSSFHITAEDIEMYDGDHLGIQLTRFITAVQRVIDRFEAEF